MVGEKDSISTLYYDKVLRRDKNQSDKGTPGLNWELKSPVNGFEVEGGPPVILLLPGLGKYHNGEEERHNESSIWVPVRTHCGSWVESVSKCQDPTQRNM